MEKLELYVTNYEGHAPPIDRFSSLRWRRKYFEPGEFELHVPTTLHDMDLLSVGRAIKRRDRKEVGIVETCVAKNDDLAVSGRFGSAKLEGYVVPKLIYSGTTVGAMQAAVLDNTLNNFTCTDSSGNTSTVALQVRWRYLLELLTALARTSTVGFRLNLSDSGLEGPFETYAGVDRTIHQSAVHPVEFSDDFGNLLDPTYTESTKNYRTYAWVAGEGEGDARKVVTVGSGASRAIYVDARDLQKGDLTDAQYEAQLMQRGMEKLQEYGLVQSFEAAALDTGRYRYLTDWDLGDVVTVLNRKWGITMDARITEIEEVYENNTVTVTPTLGNPLPEAPNFGDD